MADFKVVSHVPETLDDLKDKMKTAMKAVAEDMEGEAVLEIQSDPVRVDTGLLKNSITSGIGGGSVSKSVYTADSGDGSGSYGGELPDDEDSQVTAFVGTNVEYAKYVHDGTTKLTPPNRFLRNALDNNKDRYKQVISEHLK